MSQYNNIRINLSYLIAPYLEIHEPTPGTDIQKLLHRQQNDHKNGTTNKNTMYFYQYAQLPLIPDCSFILICPVSISCLQYLQLGIPLYSCTHFPSTHSVGGFPHSFGHLCCLRSTVFYCVRLTVDSMLLRTVIQWKPCKRAVHTLYTIIVM